MSAISGDLNQKLEQLQSELSTRRSTLYFARTAVALMVALIFAGATGKLFWDSRHTLTYAIAGAGTLFVLGLIVYSVVQYVTGRRVLRAELSRFEELQQVRRQLRLDDPPSLLPSR